MVSVRLSDQLFDKLSSKAKSQGATVSDLLRSLIRSTFDMPIGFKCKHMVVVFPEGQDDSKPSVECGCDMTPIYNMSEVLAVRPLES